MSKHIIKRAFVNKLLEYGIPKEAGEAVFTKYAGNLLEILGGATLGGGTGYLGGNIINSLVDGGSDIIPVISAILGTGVGGLLAGLNEPSVEDLQDKLFDLKMEEFEKEQKKRMVEEMNKKYYGGTL